MADASRPAPDSDSPSADWYAQQWARLCDELGVTDPEAVVEEFSQLQAELERLRDERDQRSRGDAVSDAAQELLDADTAADVRALAERIVDQAGRLARLTEQTEETPDAPTPDSVDEALATMERTADQIADLRDAYEQRADAAERLAAINDVLGIRSGEEAEELSALARDMERQLEALYAEKEKLRDLGLGSIEDAVDMVESMETQLSELYQDREALQETPAGAPDQQSTFQQLEALYAEQEKLQQALGVSSANDVIEMVETLTSQLEDLYERIDAASQADGDAALQVAASSPVPDSPLESGGADADKDVALASMARQLEALYREKKVLLERGLHSAQAAASRLEAQQTEIETLQRENQTYAQRLDRLATELGTADADTLVDLIRALEDEAGTSAEVLLESSAPQSPAPDTPPRSLLDPDVLDRLDEMSPDEIDALDVGVVRLSDDGTVEFLNEAAHRLSELPDPDSVSGVIGANFFTDLVPSTANALFYGRFRAGRRRETMDTRFTYTFARPDADDRTFAVHLYRAPDHDANWVLFRPV